MRYLLIFSLFLFSCSSPKKQSPTETYNGKYPRIDRLFAVYTDTSGLKVPAIVLRQINKLVKYDSLQKKDVISVDTIWGVERVIPPDSVGGKPSIRWVEIGADSINTRVENRSIDSLTKK